MRRKATAAGFTSLERSWQAGWGPQLRLEPQSKWRGEEQGTNRSEGSKARQRRHCGCIAVIGQEARQGAKRGESKADNKEQRQGMTK